ncbi:MAG TPA: D-glycero-beta-D-manno-heptose 1-phosphate adenylyltransferase [Bacteroidales bacterium]|nr:D-glycero-beta-D-manno-heptose 1-phosphate adenylyltransferase [Bacteroidales bacterium]
MSHHGYPVDKIITPGALHDLKQNWSENHRNIVFTNGCFDILHRGHIDYLYKAAQLGDILIIGLNSDASVRRIKGPERPLQDEDSRAMILAALEFTDYVIMFDEDTPYELITAVQPDILVKGSDYKAEDIVGYDIVTAKGGRVITIGFLPGYSTSAIVDKIRGEG